MRSTLLLLSVVIFAALAPSRAQADPPRTPALQCTAGGMTARPKFTQRPPGRAEYRFGGACIGRDGHSFAYRLDATWTPSENGAGNANATEILHIDMTSGPSQSYSIVLGARCGADPWLHNAVCQRVGDNVPDEVSAWWWDVTSMAFPFSRRGIPHDQRIALRGQYDRANDGVLDRSTLYSDRATIEAIDRVSTQAAGMDMAEQTAPAAARPTGAEAGIIIVSGNTPYRRTANVLAPVMTQDNESMQVSKPANSDPPICASARKARARNSPATAGLEAQCRATGGDL